MIVKVAPSRRDGKSSFKDLGAYLTQGILQSGEPPLKTSWDALTQYITAESVLNELGDEVEKTIAVEIGNVNSLKTAPLEMRAVARRNPRQKDPVYHYILSWRENERPDTQDIFKAARHTLKALGLSEHQYIIAIHANTDNLHAHIEVNRVHPKTYKATTLNFAHATLHKAAREAEIEFGWSHDNGIYEVVEVNGKKHIVKASERGDVERQSKAGASRFEVWNGEESLETWCKGAPAVALRQVLADPAASDWQGIHGVLARFGLELRDSGGNGMKVFDVSDEGTAEKQGKPVAVSASSAFRFMKRAELEKRFGPFEVRDESIANVLPEKTYKRDPAKRLERKLERRAIRDALHTRFKSEALAVKEQRAIAKQVVDEVFQGDKNALTQLDAKHRAQRLTITKANDLSPKQKKALHALNRAGMQQERRAMKELLARTRAEKRALLPQVPVWREWVEQQALLGDEAAISALRGMIYQDGREAKKASKETATDVTDDGQNTVRPAQLVDTDPYVRPTRNLIWKVSRNGRVNYAFASGTAAFCDDGNKLAYNRKDVTDEALVASLRYAAEKWNGEIRLSGGDTVFKERALRVAVANGIRVANPELQRLQSQLQASHERTVQQPKDSAYEDILSLIRARDKEANVQRPAGKTAYVGSLVGTNGRYIAQHLGGSDYVVHEKSSISGTLPKDGKTFTVGYENGAATIKGKRVRTR